MPAHPATPAPVSAPAVAAAPAEKPAKNLIEIKSPTVGTFYAQREPGTPPFITVGTRVSPSTVVCLIEAMKVFNEIKAEMNGTVIDVLVENQEAVEFNQPLFLIKR